MSGRPEMTCYKVLDLAFSDLSINAALNGVKSQKKIHVANPNYIGLRLIALTAVFENL